MTGATSPPPIRASRSKPELETAFERLEMPNEVGFDAATYVAEDERHEKREGEIALKIALIGLAMAAMVTVVQNAFILAKVKFTEWPDGVLASLGQAVRLGVRPELGLATSVGLVAVVATLAVAVVATNLQPPTNHLDTEVRVSRAGSTFLVAARASSALTVAIAALVLPDLAIAFLCALLALVATVVAAGVGLRVDERRREIKLLYLAKYCESLEARVNALQNVRPWVKNTKHYSALVFVFVLAPLTTSCGIVAFIVLLFPFDDLQRQYAAELLLFVLLAALPITLVAGLLSIAITSRWEMSSRRDCALYLTLATFGGIAFSIPGIAVVIASRSVGLTILFFVPLTTLLTLLVIGRSGRGPGRVLWTSPARALDRRVSSARSELASIAGTPLVEREEPHGGLPPGARGWQMNLTDGGRPTSGSRGVAVLGLALTAAAWCRWWAGRRSPR